MIPAASQSASSLAFVPDSSARDAKLSSASAISANASGASLAFETRAGSSAGPTITKSLCITAFLLAPCPSAMKSSSAAGEWTKSTSASPRAPSSIASPEPTAKVFAEHPEVFSKVGSSSSSSPESRVLVVVASTMVPRSGAEPSPLLSLSSSPQALARSAAVRASSAPAIRACRRLTRRFGARPTWTGRSLASPPGAAAEQRSPSGPAAAPRRPSRRSRAPARTAR